MGIVSKGAKCNVDNCDQDGARSLNTAKVENAGLRVNSKGKKIMAFKKPGFDNNSSFSEHTKENTHKTSNFFPYRNKTIQFDFQTIAIPQIIKNTINPGKWQFTQSFTILS